VSDVDEPWRKDVPVSEMGDVDFQRRSSQLTVYDSSGETQRLVMALSNHYELSTSLVIDRAVRVYLAHVIDTATGRLSEIRHRYGTVAMIPPKGFTHEWCAVTPVESSPLSETYTASTPPVVSDMIDEVIEHEDYESRSQFVQQAILHFANNPDES